MVTAKDVNSVPQDEPPRRPEVIVEFLFDRGMLFLSINNVGERPAVNITVKFDQKIVGLGGSKQISEMPLFRSLRFLGPHREIVTLVDSTASYFSRRQPVEVTARISYKDNSSRQYEEVIRHNLEVFRELAYVDEPDETDNRPQAEV